MRCAIYARVSTEFDSQKTSIDNQIDLFRNYANENNWEIVKVYTDKKSGTKVDRPGLKSLIADGKAKLFDVILAKELSRLARNGRLSYELRDICQLNNIHIVCLDNSINTLTGEVQNFGLYAWLYENESLNNSRRNKASKRTKAVRGEFTGSNPTYGYYNDGGKLKIRHDQSPDIVRRIFNCYLEGTGMDSIAKTLIAEGVPTPSQVAKKANASTLWHASTIKNILKNRHYCGDLVQHKTERISVTTTKRRTLDEENLIVHRDMHESIISRETFEAVQRMLQSRTRIGKAPKKHLFTNVLYCKECGRGMWYKFNQKGYRCGGNLKYGDFYCLNKKAVKELKLKEIVLAYLKELFQAFQDDSMMKSLMKKLEQKQQEFQKEMSNVNNQIQDLRLKKLEYLNLYTEQVITKQELIEYRELTDKKLKELDIIKAQIHQNLEECTNENYTIELGNKLKNFFPLKDLDSKLLHSLVEKITVCIDGNIDIHYTFINPFQNK
ncbi:recombinase family protein [Priestia sp. YIM B13551]|uniref:recombinase family protein n=1 Tax=Priestia sp. YIM B13551 TaxID=3366306 RepID=UPI00366AA085